jgi:hypothetical protein
VTIFGKDTEGVLEESKIAKDWEKYQSISGSTNIHIPTIQEVQSSETYAFISMPFKKEMDKVYRNAIIPSLQENGIAAKRADMLPIGGHIQEQIKATIETAHLIIAEVSDNSPNVIFEVGYAMALKKPILLLRNPLITQLNVPFDIMSYRIITYKSINDLKKSLTKQLSEFRSKGII